MKKSILVVAAVWGAACSLPTADATLGKPCTEDDDCLGSTLDLECTEDTGRCMPAETETPLVPDTRGRSCDAALPLATTRSPLLNGSIDVTVTNANTASAADDGCGDGRVLFVRFDVDAGEDAAGVPRPGIVLRARVEGPSGVQLALQDASCGALGPFTCSPLKGPDEGELVLPGVAAGSYTLAVSSPVMDVPLRITVEQVACPYGFVPAGDECLGFVAISAAEPRVSGHRLDALPDGRVMLSGGRDSESGARRSDLEILELGTRRRSVHEMDIGRASHTGALGPSGTFYLIGGSNAPDLSRDPIMTVAPNAMPTPDSASIMSFAYFRSSLEDGCVAAAGAGMIELYASCPTEGAAVLARYEDDTDLTWAYVVTNRPVDASARGGGLITLSGGGQAGGALAAFLAGGVDENGAPATPYVLLDPNTLAPFDPEVVSLWVRFPSAPDADQLVARSNAAMVDIAGRIAIAGGELVGGAPSADIEIVAPLQSDAILRGTLAQPRARTAAVSCDGRDLFVIGGADGAGALRTTEIVDTATGRSRVGPMLPRALESTGAVCAAGSRIIVAGGSSAADGPLEAFLELVRIAPDLDAPEVGFDSGVVGDDCRSPIEVTPPRTIQGSTFRAVDSFSATVLDGECLDYSSPGVDVVYQVHVPAGAALRAELRSVGDLLLLALDTCDTRATCIAATDELYYSYDEPIEPEVLTLAASAQPRDVFLVVDSGWPINGADYELVLSLEEGT